MVNPEKILEYVENESVPLARRLEMLIRHQQHFADDILKETLQQLSKQIGNGNATNEVRHLRDNLQSLVSRRTSRCD